MADIGTAPLTTQKRQSVNKYSVRDIPIVLSVDEKTQVVHCILWHVKKIHQRKPFTVSLLWGTDHIRSWPMGVPLTLGKVFDPKQQPSGRVLASVSTPCTPSLTTSALAVHSKQELILVDNFTAHALQLEPGLWPEFHLLQASFSTRQQLQVSQARTSPDQRILLLQVSAQPVQRVSGLSV